MKAKKSTKETFGTTRSGWGISRKESETFLRPRDWENSYRRLAKPWRAEGTKLTSILSQKPVSEHLSPRKGHVCRLLRLTQVDCKDDKQTAENECEFLSCLCWWDLSTTLLLGRRLENYCTVIRNSCKEQKTIFITFPGKHFQEWLLCSELIVFLLYMIHEAEITSKSKK